METNSQKAIAIIIGTVIGIIWIIAAMLPDYTLLWNH